MRDTQTHISRWMKKGTYTFPETVYGFPRFVLVEAIQAIFKDGQLVQIIGQPNIKDNQFSSSFANNAINFNLHSPEGPPPPKNYSQAIKMLQKEKTKLSKSSS